MAKKERIDFQHIIIRFLHERLLYRLSVSDYSQQLILKGGALIYAMQGLKSRPTIGFGDIVIPVVQELEYPILLDDMQVPVIQAYSKETVVAEKFQAMIELSVANSRMKDFYDVYILLTDNDFENDTLEEAIKATFANRETFFTEDHALFSVDFASNMLRKRSWTAFVNKIKRNKELEFEEVMRLISEKLLPYWTKMKEI